MQTFVPLDTFEESAASLDRQRLGKQRVEVLQICKALTGDGGWGNHPATKMWRGHENGLAAYGVAVCLEWKGRGYKDTCLEKISAFYEPDPDDLPGWWGEEALHLSHRSNLVRKMPEHYGLLWPDVPADLEYVWPA